jgi:hypothetical protein
VGPAELPNHKHIKDLTQGETIGHSDVFLYLSHANVSNDRVRSASNNSEFEPLEHSVYIGRLRLGRYVRVGLSQYAAYDADDRPFAKRTDALAAFDIVGGKQ